MASLAILFTLVHFIDSVLFRFCRPFLNEASLLARTLVSVEELVEAWQDTQGDVCLLLSPLLTPALEETPEIRAKHRQVLTHQPHDITYMSLFQ